MPSVDSAMRGKHRPYLVGVAGGSCSGKSSFIQKMVDKLMSQMGARLSPGSRPPRIAIINVESFFVPLTDEQQALAAKGQMNMEHPAVIEEEHLHRTMEIILNNEANSHQPLYIPMYDSATMKHSVEKASKILLPVDIVFLEGALSFYFPAVRHMMDLRLFVDCDPDIRLARRVLRDMQQYKKSLTYILDYHSMFVKPAFDDYCLPTKKYAHIIIPRGCENDVAIDLIVQHLQEVLRENGAYLQENGHSLICGDCQQPACKCTVNGDQDHLSAH